MIAAQVVSGFGTRVKCCQRRADLSSGQCHIEVIDSELRLLLAIRRMVGEVEGRPPSTALIDELLDELAATLGRAARCRA